MGPHCNGLHKRDNSSNLLCYVGFSILGIILLVKMRNAALSVVKDFHIPINIIPPLYHIFVTDCSDSIQTVAVGAACFETLTDTENILN